MSAENFITAARSFVGTPFKHGQRLPGVGIDCIGVLVCAAQACGYSHQDKKAYPLRPDGQLVPILDAQLQRVPVALRGDIFAMAFDDKLRGITEEPHHVAIYAGETIIHAYAQAKKCVEQPMTAAWWDRVRIIYRFKDQ